MIKGPINQKSIEAKKMLEGIYRQTLTYNETAMLCRFILEKDAEIPLY